jgi:hypothetical protein
MKMKAFLPLIALLLVSCGGKHITVAAPGTPGWNPADVAAVSGTPVASGTRAARRKGFSVTFSRNFLLQ